MNTLWQRQQGRTLLVLLPGAYMQAGDFAEQGLFADAREQRPQLDLCAVDLDLAAISAGEALPALHREILAPARHDYTAVWLGGISLGGLLALCQAADWPDSVDGLCLIAPYPGSRLTTQAIEKAGGLQAWQATPAQLTDPEFRAWRWLQRPPAGFPAFAGYGTEDRFAQGMRQIAECLPPDARCAVPGEHDWPAWRAIWRQFLASRMLDDHVAGQGA